MKKRLTALAVFGITTVGGSLTSIGVSQTQLVKHQLQSNDFKMELVDQLASTIMVQQLAGKVADGSTLTAGSPAGDALPVLYNLIESVKPQAIKVANTIPFLVHYWLVQLMI